MKSRSWLTRADVCQHQCFDGLTEGTIAARLRCALTPHASSKEYGVAVSQPIAPALPALLGTPIARSKITFVPPIPSRSLQAPGMSSRPTSEHRGAFSENDPNAPQTARLTQGIHPAPTQPDALAHEHQA